MGKNPERQGTSDIEMTQMEVKRASRRRSDDCKRTQVGSYCADSGALSPPPLGWGSVSIPYCTGDDELGFELHVYAPLSLHNRRLTADILSYTHMQLESKS